MEKWLELFDAPVFFVLGMGWATLRKKFPWNDPTPYKWKCPVPGCTTKFSLSRMDKDVWARIEAMGEDHIKHFHPDFMVVNLD